MVRYKYFYLLLALLLVQITFAGEIGPTTNLFTIDSIEIKGLKKVEKDAILEKIGSKVGLVADNYLVYKDISKIYAMKYFEEVTASHEVVDGKNSLVFEVKEKPIVGKIEFQGNNEIDRDDILAQIKTKEFAIVDVSTIKSDLKKIEKMYEDKGYYLARADYEIEVNEDGSTTLTFKVTEQDKIRVKKIILLGNKAFSDKQIKDILATKEEDLFSFMSGSGNFKEMDFSTDLEKLKYFYRTKGYLQINVGKPEITLSEDKRWVFVSVRLVEGPQFTVNSISYQGEILFDDEVLTEKTSMKGGKIYSEEDLQKDIQNLTELYQDEGYAFANVLRTLEIVPGQNKVDVTFSFEKGELAYFGKVIVKGNSKTRDKVIRRELQIREGTRFSGSALRKSRENLDRLGFFEPKSVVLNTVSPKGKSNVLDVEVSVKERNTGQLSFGAGYSTASSFFVQGSIAQTNWNGMGQNLSFQLQYAKKSSSFNLGFTEPYLFDSKWTAGGDVYHSSNDMSESYKYLRKGFDVRVGHPIFEYTRLYMTYKLEDTQITDKNDPTLVESVENGIASSVETTLVRDLRNNKFEPTGGHYLSFSTEYAGLGGDKNWLKNTLEGRHYYGVWGDLVLRSRLFVSKIEEVGNKVVPRTERFTLGGARNLRGYGYEAIGPFITATTTDGYTKRYNIGGYFTSYASMELEHPLAREAGLKWVVFMDAGNVYNKQIGENSDYSLYIDYGFGFRWFSPIGILRFEWGKPLSYKKSHDSSQFFFDLGQLF